MNAWYLLMDPKFGLYISTFVTSRTGDGALGNLAGRAAKHPGERSWLTTLGKFFARRALVRELVSLDDRLLADIGVSRDQIPAMVNRLDARLATRRSLSAERTKLAA